MKKILVIAILSLFVSLGLNAEVKTAVFKVSPRMTCQNCENKIKSNLRFEKGVKNIETSLEEQTVKVTYDDTKTSPEKLKEGFGKIGYTVDCGGNCDAKAKACCKEKKCEGEAKTCCKEKKCEGETKACCKEKKCEGEAKACCKKK